MARGKFAAKAVARARRRNAGTAVELYGTTTRQTPMQMWQAQGRPGRGPINGRNVMQRNPMPKPRPTPIPLAAGPKPPRSLAREGKRVARWVTRNPGKTALLGGAGLTASAVAHSSGRSVDKTRGRPTGMYGY